MVRFPWTCQSPASDIFLEMATNVCVRIIKALTESCGFLVVTLSSTNPNVTFRGFIIQARTRPDDDLVGSFIIVDNETRVQECHLSAEDPVSPTVSGY